jgi:indolepyruvate ferredoxin oxidoreductase beta subunit
MNRHLRTRVFLTGVGGQGTLTATRILAQTALDAGLAVTAGEIHGMAQRGGVVESFVLVGGHRSPRIAHGEADVLLGFEPMETLRALPYLLRGGLVLSNSEFIPTIGANQGLESAPSLDEIKANVAQCAGEAHYIPAASLGREAGAVQSGTMVLLGSLCAANRLPFGPDQLKKTIQANLPPKLVDINLRAVDLGAGALEA